MSDTPTGGAQPQPEGNSFLEGLFDTVPPEVQEQIDAAQSARETDAPAPTPAAPAPSPAAESTAPAEPPEAPDTPDAPAFNEEAVLADAGVAVYKPQQARTSTGAQPVPSRGAAPPPSVDPATDERFMRRALELALRGRGRVEPNPLVGALVVKDDRILGEGWHGHFGGPHAEVHAIRQAGDDANGATLYVTLEPCAHDGKTPPCVQAIEAGQIRRVVYALSDPNPQARGGADLLAAANIAVTGGVLEAHARAQNLAFLKRVLRGMPAVRLKWAMTLDGKIATHTGESRWVSGEESRRHAHRGRSRVDAIVAGVQTVLRDDPELTARTGEETVRGATGRPALRVVLDSDARTPLESRLIATLDKAPLLIAVAEDADPGKIAALEAAGTEVKRLPRAQYTEGASGIDIEALLRALASRGGESPRAEDRENKECPWPVSRILVEGGGRVHASFLSAGLVEEVTAYVAPRIIGGAEAPTPVEGRGFAELKRAIDLSSMRVRRMGDDLVVEGRIGYALPKGPAAESTPSRDLVRERPPHSPEGAPPHEDDRALHCCDCGETFIHTRDAQLYYERRGFTSEPKRCPECRRQRRESRRREDGDEGGRSGRGRGRGRGGRPSRGDRGRRDGERKPPAELFDVTCGECGCATQVPFQPDPSRPVFCRDCYRSRRPERSPRRDG
jgi:diaminohydroxyphosphoribosylaminopyrimidine deaminase/5-amino-6-(5-phosphoribosylamino)uracil reductase